MNYVSWFLSALGYIVGYSTTNKPFLFAANSTRTTVKHERTHSNFIALEHCQLYNTTCGFDTTCISFCLLSWLLVLSIIKGEREEGENEKVLKKKQNRLIRVAQLKITIDAHQNTSNEAITQHKIFIWFENFVYALFSSRVRVTFTLI